jgi:hypothetical protein
VSGFVNRLPFLTKLLHRLIGAGYNHIPHNWVYPDATARNAATGFTAADLNKLALQTADNSLWILTSASPAAWAFVGGKESIPVAVSDETSAITAGTAKVTFRMPTAFTLSTVRASLTTAQTSGALLTVDIKVNGVSILSTKITLDNTEKTSVTAAALPVLSTTVLADDAEITIDVSQVGDGTAKGLKVYLIGAPV